MRLVWWQRLVLARLLEVDSQGRLVWLSAVLSMPRQVGKSWLLRALAMWRIHQTARFGEEQTVMHISRGLSASREVQRAARMWARERKPSGYNSREQNGAQEVSTPDGSRWLIRDMNGAYGFSASLAIVDEAWGVDVGHVEEGLEPTLPQRSNPQLVLVSTAHRRTTALMPERRALAVGRLRNPGSALLIEWSAPTGTPPSVGAARDCSPWWSEAREALALEAFERMAAAGPAGHDSGPGDAFITQTMNRWPAGAYTRDGIVPLVDAEVWARAADLTAHPTGPLIVAVDDRMGVGAAAAAAGMSDDGRVIVWGQLFRNRALAANWAALLAESRPGSRVVVGAVLVGDDAFPAAAKVSTADAAAAWPKLRELLAAGMLAHDGGTELSTQIVAVKVAERTGGLGVISRSRSDLARCASWAIAAAAVAPAPKPRWAMV
jgi:hypothetical protein